MNSKILVSLLLSMAAVPAHAQLLDVLSNQVIKVPIEHPGSVPIKFKVVAMATPVGRCSAELQERIEMDFINNGITLVERQQIDKLMAEHNLQASGALDPKTAASFGKMAGAQSLMMLTVRQCIVGTSAQRTDSGTKYTTTGKIAGSLKVVDLTTGRSVAMQPIEDDVSFTSSEGYVNSTEVIEEASKKAALSVHKMFLPWTETQLLTFFDDKECDLKAAWKFLKDKDYAAALTQSETNLKTCIELTAAKPKSKDTLAHAYYNLGVVQFVRGEYDAALGNLAESGKLKKSSLVKDAVSYTTRAKEYATAVVRYEAEPANFQEAAVQASPAPAKSAVSQQAAAPAGGSTVEDRLLQLESLKKKGLVTQDEYNKKKAEILKDM